MKVLAIAAGAAAVLWCGASAADPIGACKAAYIAEAKVTAGGKYVGPNNDTTERDAQRQCEYERSTDPKKFAGRYGSDTPASPEKTNSDGKKVGGGGGGGGGNKGGGTGGGGCTGGKSVGSKMTASSCT